MEISIWDAESTFLYGYVKVPLRSLLRQNKLIFLYFVNLRIYVELEKNYNIFNENYSEIKGSILLLC